MQSLTCRCPACKCREPVHPPQTGTATPAEGSGPELPQLGHPFNAIKDWDPSDEPSLQLEHLWQIPPGAHLTILPEGI